MNLFNQVEVTRPKLNKFDLSHSKSLTIPFDSGQITPVLFQEVIPGDRFRVNTGVLARFAPQLAPWYGQVDLMVRYYFVPYRIVWPESEDFFTGGVTGTSNPVMPFITMNNANKAYFAEGSLADYFGLPTIPAATVVANNQNVSALPFRGYQMCFNEWFRNQNLVTEVPYLTASGDVNADIANLCTMRKAMWQKDYFTSALPTTQRGNPVTVPVTSTVIAPATGAPAGVWRQAGTGAVVPNTQGHGTTALGTGSAGYGVPAGPYPNLEYYDPNGSLTATSTSLTINDLRLAESLQKWWELSMRVGSRYAEHLLGYFNVRSSDARLQRPEYLGGMQMPLVVSEVVSTFQDATSSAQGNMAGHGISTGGGEGVQRRFEEHGMVIGLMYIRPKTQYSQGIPKFFSKTSKFDFFYPQLAHLGEQPVVNKELYYAPTGADDNNNVFGYQSRYSEYKYGLSSIHGAFRTTLAYWTPSRIFLARPLLNSTFVSADPSNRLFAVSAAGTQNVWITLYNKVDALRPMPYYGTPSL